MMTKNITRVKKNIPELGIEMHLKGSSISMVDLT
jgi:hypothetical protein